MEARIVEILGGFLDLGGHGVHVLFQPFNRVSIDSRVCTTAELNFATDRELKIEKGGAYKFVSGKMMQVAQILSDLTSLRVCVSIP